MKSEKAIAIGVLLALLFIAYTGTASASMIYVPDNYSTIQSAVNAASPGDTIIVRDGTYIENIVVKKRLTIRSENGSDSTIVRAKKSNDYVFNVTVDYVNISGFTVERARWSSAIYLYHTDYCNISNNNCSNSWYGISLEDSNKNSISNNKCSNNRDDGIYLRRSNNNKLIDNIMLENGIVIEGYSLSDYTHEIDESNTVNGKTVYYWKDVEEERVPDDAGQVILVNCTNITIENQDLKNASIGIQIAFSSYITIKNNICSNSRYGIDLWDSKNNSISNNKCSNNRDLGIRLRDSKNNSISNNNCSNNDCGIYLRGSNNNRISNNNCSNNGYVKGTIGILIYLTRGNGIQLGDSNNNRISNNNCSNNKYDGISLWHSKNNSISNNRYDGINLVYSNNNKLKGNTMVENGIVIGGHSLSHYTHEIDESNTANGKPVCYWKDVEGGRIPEGAGQVILVNCKNVVVENQNLNNASVGIGVAFSSFITIKNNNCSKNKDGGISLGYSNSNSISNNNCSNNRYGICLWYSKNNSISNNDCSNNEDGFLLSHSNNNRISNNSCSNNRDGGIHLGDSNNNRIYLNNFIDNAKNVRFWKSTNTWNSNEKITHTCKGKTYENYLGNYWDDYTGTDADGDGIGDTHYGIDSDKDYYPLMEPFENYFAAPFVEITTDKYEYTAGDTMLINITLANPTEKWRNVKFRWQLDSPDSGLYFTIIDIETLWLPPGFDNTFTLPWTLPNLGLSFNASWYVAIYNAATSELICEDTADWRYVSITATEGETIPAEIAEELTEIVEKAELTETGKSALRKLEE